MTGTAETGRRVLGIYKLDVAIIPTNKPVTPGTRTTSCSCCEVPRRSSTRSRPARAQPARARRRDLRRSDDCWPRLKIRGIKHNVLNCGVLPAGSRDRFAGGTEGARSRSRPTWPPWNGHQLGAGGWTLGGLHPRHRAPRGPRHRPPAARPRRRPGRSSLALQRRSGTTSCASSAPERISALMERMGVWEGEVIGTAWSRHHLARAEAGRGAQLRHPQAPAREYDNVMNKQREVYRQRNAALVERHQQAMCSRDIREVVAERVERYTPEKGASRRGGTCAVSRTNWATCSDARVARGSPTSAWKACRRTRSPWPSAPTAGARPSSRQAVPRPRRHLYLFTVDERWREHLHDSSPQRAASACARTARRTRSSVQEGKRSGCSRR